MAFADELEELVAVEVRHDHVAQHEVDGGGLQALQRLAAARRHDHGAPFLGQQVAQRLADAEVVVDHEDADAAEHPIARLARRMPVDHAAAALRP